MVAVPVGRCVSGPLPPPRDPLRGAHTPPFARRRRQVVQAIRRPLDPTPLSSSDGTPMTSRHCSRSAKKAGSGCASTPAYVPFGAHSGVVEGDVLARRSIEASGVASMPSGLAFPLARSSAASLFLRDVGFSLAEIGELTAEQRRADRSSELVERKLALPRSSTALWSRAPQSNTPATVQPRTRHAACASGRSSTPASTGHPSKTATT
jgi:hypothetical protein